MVGNLVQKLLLSVGGGAMLFGALVGYSGFNRASWAAAPATVVDVSTECRMEARERELFTRTTYSKTLDCADVDLFKTVNADKSWTTTEYVLTTLDVGGAMPARASMERRRAEGELLPKKGDRIEVLQNPSKPERVTETGTPRSEMWLGGLAFAFGAGLIGLYLRNRRSADTNGFALGEATVSASASSTAMARRTRVIDAQRAAPAASYPQTASQRSGAPASPRLGQASGQRTFGQR